MKVLILLFYILSLVSCSQYSYEEQKKRAIKEQKRIEAQERSDCQFADWKNWGREDAINGRSFKSFSRHASICQKFKFRIDKKSYQEGYNIGLESYCTKSNGYQVGKSGETYRKICPANKEEKFLLGFIEGDRLRELKLIEEKKLKEFKLNEQEKASKLEKERRLKRNRDAYKYEVLEKILRNKINRKCHFDSDCEIEDDCDNNHCMKSGKSCTFDSDCEIQGECTEKKICRYY